MKSIIFAVILFVACMDSAVGQKVKQANVPAAVMTAFKAKFPTAEKAKWEKENATEFEVNFKQNGQSFSALIHQDGKWLETEQEIKASDLPEAVRTAMAKDFNGYKAEEIEKVETADKGMMYEMELEKGKETLEVQFSADGTVLKKAVEKGKKD